MNEWLTRWQIPGQCWKELVEVLDAPTVGPIKNPGRNDGSETWAQNATRIEASKRGARLWRNNRGAVTTDTGRHVRFGLANDSMKMDKYIKSSDLIGITPVIISEDMVGSMVGVFTSIEMKKPGWTFSPTDGREVAQLDWLKLIISLGGFATFATGPQNLDNL